MINITQSKLKQLVGNNAAKVRKAEERVIGKDSLQMCALLKLEDRVINVSQMVRVRGELITAIFMLAACRSAS